MIEIPEKIQQKGLGLHLLLKTHLTSIWHLEMHAEFTASHVDDAWQLFNIVRNPNITVSNRKLPSVSLLTSRSVHIVLRSLD